MGNGTLHHRPSLNLVYDSGSEKALEFFPKSSSRYCEIIGVYRHLHPCLQNDGKRVLLYAVHSAKRVGVEIALRTNVQTHSAILQSLHDLGMGIAPDSVCDSLRTIIQCTTDTYRSIGLSCVKLEGVELTADRGAVLHVAGADLLDGTPIFDIKPYVRYADSHPDALGGWTGGGDSDALLRVECPEALLSALPPDRREALLGVLANDPRPHYQADPDRVYGLRFAGYNVRFTVAEDVLTVREIAPEP